MKEKQLFNRKEVEGLAWRAYLVGKTKYKNLDFVDWLVMEFSLLDTDVGINENRNNSGRKDKRVNA